MKKFIFSLLMMLSPVMLMAQNEGAKSLRFGYFSYEAAMKGAAEYAKITKGLEELRAKYDAEMHRVTEDFNAKYESFLEGQKDFAPSIRNKRQAELQDLMEKNIAFKAESERLLKQAERDAFAPLHNRIQTIVQRIGMARGLAFVLNTDNNAVPFLNPSMGENLNDALHEELK